MAFFGFGKKEKDKMKTGLEKTRTGFWGSIMNTLTGSVIDDEMYDDLEEQLILADVGGEVAVHLVDKLRDRVRDKGLKTGEQAADALRDIIAEEMTPEAEMALDGKPAAPGCALPPPERQSRRQPLPPPAPAVPPGSRWGHIQK